MVNDNRDVYGRWINNYNPRITKSPEQTNTYLWKFLNSFLKKKKTQTMIDPEESLVFFFFCCHDSIRLP